MKKIFLWLLIMTIAPIAFAAETQKDYGKLCEELWGQHLILESFPVQEKCSIDGENLSLASFQDKYNHFVLGVMIHYASEFKYSATDKWKDYNEFLAQDIKDLEIFSKMKLSTDMQKKVWEDIKIYTDIYNFWILKSAIWDKNATKIDTLLSKYEAKIPEKKLIIFYKNIKTKLEKKISQMEYTLTVARFTQEWYKKFQLQLNACKYLLQLVQWRMQ